MRQSERAGDYVVAFIEATRAKAEEFRRFGNEPQAKVCEVLADELDAKRKAFLDEEITIAEAAELSGYHESAIRKMRDDGRIPETSKGRVRRGDVPKKPGHGVSRRRPSLMVEQTDGDALARRFLTGASR